MYICMHINISIYIYLFIRWPNDALRRDAHMEGPSNLGHPPVAKDACPTHACATQRLLSKRSSLSVSRLNVF